MIRSSYFTKYGRHADVPKSSTSACLASGGLRERKKLATRRAIGAAALRLAVERGLANVLVEEIAAEANVSPRTFNNYFSSKCEAICFLGEDRAQRIGEALRIRPAAEPLWDAIAHAMLAHYAGMDGASDRDWLTTLRPVLSSPLIRAEYLQVMATMRNALAQAIADRASIDITRDMFPEILAGAVIAASQVAVGHWRDAVPPAPFLPMLRQALRQLEAAFPAT